MHTRQKLMKIRSRMKRRGSRWQVSPIASRKKGRWEGWGEAAFAIELFFTILLHQVEVKGYFLER
jgi:hypothetical protein